MVVRSAGRRGTAVVSRSALHYESILPVPCQRQNWITGWLYSSVVSSKSTFDWILILLSCWDAHNVVNCCWICMLLWAVSLDSNQCFAKFKTLSRNYKPFVFSLARCMGWGRLREGGWDGVLFWRNDCFLCSYVYIIVIQHHCQTAIYCSSKPPFPPLYCRVELYATFWDETQDRNVAWFVRFKRCA